jgi:hypothetical protein
VHPLVAETKALLYLVRGFRGIDQRLGQGDDTDGLTHRWFTEHDLADHLRNGRLRRCLEEWRLPFPGTSVSSESTRTPLTLAALIEAVCYVGYGKLVFGSCAALERLCPQQRPSSGTASAKPIAGNELPLPSQIRPMVGATAKDCCGSTAVYLVSRGNRQQWVESRHSSSLLEVALYSHNPCPASDRGAGG